MVVTAAKAHKLQAIDAVYIDYKDMEGLRRQSEEGAGWGFTGKQVIHPGQVSEGRLVNLNDKLDLAFNNVKPKEKSFVFD